DVRWGHQGILDLIDYLGLDPGLVWGPPCRHARPKLTWLFDPACTDNHNCWLTVRSPDGSLADYFLMDDSASMDVLLLGPELFDRLKELPESPIPVEWSDAEDVAHPNRGAFLDRTRNLLSVWNGESAPGYGHQFTWEWPGWTVERQEAGWHGQLAL